MRAVSDKKGIGGITETEFRLSKLERLWTRKEGVCWRDLESEDGRYLLSLELVANGICRGKISKAGKMAHIIAVATNGSVEAVLADLKRIAHEKDLWITWRQANNPGVEYLEFDLYHAIESRDGDGEIRTHPTDDGRYEFVVREKYFGKFSAQLVDAANKCTIIEDAENAMEVMLMAKKYLIRIEWRRP